MRKRQKFIVSSALLSVGLLAIQFVSLELRYAAILGFSIITYFVSAWALLDDLRGIEWFTILILPTFYAAAIGLFYFLLPSGFLSKLAILGLFGFGMYSIYLTENIFSVAAVRTIQLLRAAHAVGFLMTILVMVLFYNTIYSLQLPYWFNSVVVFMVTLPLVMQTLWSMQLKPTLGSKELQASLLLSLIVAEVALVISMLPITVWIGALFLASVAYVLVGMMQHALHGKLFEKTFWEYVVVGVFVIFATMLVMPWH